MRTQTHPAGNLTAAWADYERAVAAEQALRRDYAHVLQQIAEAEQAVARAQAALLAAMAARGVWTYETETARATRVVADHGHYDPTRLPDWVLAEPGVTKTVVDRAAVEALVKDGRLPKPVAAAAWIARTRKPTLRVTWRALPEGQPSVSERGQAA